VPREPVAAQSGTAVVVTPSGTTTWSTTAAAVVAHQRSRPDAVNVRALGCQGERQESKLTGLA
jgi:hypothetical protein